MRWCMVVTTFVLLSVAVPRGASPAVPLQPGTPDRVEVGVWLGGIHGVDFVNGSFPIDFYMWWISANPDFDRFESLQILNARDWSVRAVNRRVLPDGRLYVSAFVSAAVTTTGNCGSSLSIGSGCASWSRPRTPPRR